MDDRSLSLTVWRESVCLADDCAAPHELRPCLPPAISLGQVADRLLVERYLASIAGGKATWILEAARRPLAVFAQQWSHPRFLVAPARALMDLVDPALTPHLQFRYWCQADPERVFECLRRGEPLPDRYGR